MKVKSESEVTQSCPTVSDPMDCSLPGSSIRGIFQARVLELGAIAFSAKCLEAGPKSRLQNQQLRVGKREHQRKSNAWRAPGPEEVLSVFSEWISETMNEEEDSE